MDRLLVMAGLFGGLLLLGGPPGARAAVDENAPPPPAAPAAQPAEAAAAQSPRFPPDQIDQMVAPVALYPDPLLMQVLIASSYPLEVVEAERWRTQNASLKDDALDKALEAKDWDPSVEGLTHFPDLLKRMSDNLDWTKDMGDAFLAQKDDVLDAVQRMRRLAQEAGTLQTTKEQTVTKEVVKEKETIIIQPAQPEVVYVPTYPPTVYGSAAPPQPYYPAAYGYTGGQMATASLLSFGLGVGVGALISNGCDWDDHDVHVNNNYYNNGGGGGGGGGNNNNNVNIDNSKNITRNKGDRGQKTWQHNPEHRRNVGYRDPGTAKRYGGQGGTAGAGRGNSDLARGYDRGGAGSRPGSSAQRPAGRPTTLPANAAQRPDRAGGGGGGGRPSGDRGATAQPKAQGGGRQDAFSGYGNGRATQQASQRGAASTGGKSWAGSPQGGQRASGSGSRGGGGGGGRGGGGGGGGGRGGGGGSRGGGGGGRRR